MRIEFVVPTMVYAGMEMVVARLMRGLTARGHDVGVTCIESAGALGEDLRAQGWRVTVVPTPGWRTNVAPHALAARFRQLRPDVVHSNSGAWLKAARAARIAGRARVVHTVHGLQFSEPWYESHYNRIAGMCSDVVVPVSLTLASYMQECGVPARKIKVILNGVSTTEFRPDPRSAAIRDQLGLKEDALLVGHVARFDEVKNQGMLIDAFAILRQRLPQCMLILAGDGPLRESHEARIAAHGLHDHVRLVGLVQDPAPLYREFDLFVLPSQSEGTSMSMLEAMSSGVCCLATAVGGNTALLEHGQCGILVSAEIDALRLADSIGEALVDAPRRAALGAAARECVLRKHGEDAVVDSYERLYAARPAQRHSTAVGV